MSVLQQTWRVAALGAWLVACVADGGASEDPVGGTSGGDAAAGGVVAPDGAPGGMPVRDAGPGGEAVPDARVSEDAAPPADLVVVPPDVAPAPDQDADGVPDDRDNCPAAPNPLQRDADEDLLGDACDAGDADGDGVADRDDACPLVANAPDADTDADGLADACDVCAQVPDPLQEDADSDGIGDACEIPNDDDADGVHDSRDNCVRVANGDQADRDQDAVGDACDRCPDAADPEQGDGDGDGLGDGCDVCPEVAVNGADHLDADADGQPACAGDCDDNDPARKAGGREICDGLDNDCDLDVDEDFPGLGEACGVGQGQCREAGFVACVSEAEVACNAVAHPPQLEVCDRMDNDCDGQVDDGLEGCCELGEMAACGQDEGECSVGVQTCEAGGRWSACDGQGPVAEVCDGLDNDCDGLADDGLGVRRCGRGICDHEVPVCLLGVAMECDPLEGAGEEICNGADDDCDGVVDPPPCGNIDVLDYALLQPVFALLLLY